MPNKYQRLAAALRTELEQHRSDQSYRLPTEMELTRSYHVSRQTVRQALSVLEKEGLIIRRQGSGTYPAAAVSAPRIAAVILPDTRSYIYPSVLREIQSFFTAQNYSVQVFTTEYLFEKEREILLSLLKSAVSVILAKGIHTAFPNPNLDLYEKIKNQGIPLIFWGGSYLRLSDSVNVSGDGYAGGYQLASYFIENRHHAIAGVFCKDDRDSQEKYLGCVSAMHAHKLPVRDQAFFWYDSMPCGQHKSLVRVAYPEEFLSYIISHCSAVLCHNDEAAYYLIFALRQRGVSIPGQISVAGFDNSHLSEISPVKITTMAYAQQKPWLAAAQLLIDGAKGRKADSQYLPWRLQKKDSDQINPDPLSL
ncbi:MAG: GntR family transcriptional regulator [Eubacteriales bacterium]|nr:GntR family transcriptional regulator [Eubacteriales bacterium]